ncbi:hypothetical protein SO802_010894 [Lithocarpus litseifolius]|uniref:Reverse transcriptase domain-containing protein n=1 Tax=Lithocarpus litseifolius TaxID=425828 RepID=A0AAW2DHQ4_9ROSI
MGFTAHWINLMMLCVKTVTYSILVNGEPKGMIIPTRGIRQGDPLSPFLFLLCTKSLNGLLNNAAHQGHVKGYSLCRNSPPLTHLLFADDSLLFCRATIKESQRVLDILDVYGKCSGQQINRSKTTIFFSKSTKVDSRNQIKLALRVPEIIQYEKYLGLPSLMGRNKKASFNYTKERVWKKLQGWKEKLLSQARREILIKAVIQAIPISTMSYFKLPVGLCLEIKSLIRRFWWGQKGERRKVHWVKWDTLCLPKKEGEMGFKDLANFNDAFLAKQAWRLLHNKDSLFYRVFKMKFFPNCNIVPGFEDGRVSDLINPCIRTWDENLVHGLFLPEEAAMVLSIPLSHTPVEEKIIWPFTPSVRNFMWRACKEAIPTKHNLLKRKILNEDKCEHCGVESETTAHALWNCSTMDEIWESTSGFEDRSQLGALNIMDLINLTHEKRKNVDLLAMVMWTIWHQRNQLHASSNVFPKAQVLQQASQALTKFQQSQQSLTNHAAATGPQHCA